MTNPVKSPLNKLAAAISKTVAYWQTKNNVEYVTEQVQKLLNSKRDEAILKLIGFDNNWGRWEVSSNNSMVGNMIKESVQNNNAFFQEIAKNFEPDAKTKAAVLKIVQQHYKDTLIQETEKRLNEIIHQKVEKLVQEIASTEEIDKILSLTKIIEGTQSENHNSQSQ